MASKKGGTPGDWQHANLSSTSAQAGDKIDFKRTGYFHTGIADGKGGVFHYSGEPTNKAGAAIRHDPIVDVATGHTRINNAEDGYMKPLPASQIMKSCQAAMGSGGGLYHLFKNNCEHTANSFRYGQKVSGQMNEANEHFGKIPDPKSAFQHDF